MEELKVTEIFEDRNPAQVFEAGRVAFADLDMRIVKDRSFALLLQACTTGDHVTNANFIVNGFQNEFTLTLASETADQDALKILANRFVEALNNHLIE